MAENKNADLQTRLPSQVEDQPDPFLQMSTERSYGGGVVTILGLVVALILGVVLYGLNGSNANPENTAVAANTMPNPAASAPPKAPAAPKAAAPAAQQKGPGGNP